MESAPTDRPVGRVDDDEQLSEETLAMLRELDEPISSKDLELEFAELMNKQQTPPHQTSNTGPGVSSEPISNSAKAESVRAVIEPQSSSPKADDDTIVATTTTTITTATTATATATITTPATTTTATQGDGNENQAMGAPGAIQLAKHDEEESDAASPSMPPLPPRRRGIEHQRMSFAASGPRPSLSTNAQPSRVSHQARRFDSISGNYSISSEDHVDPSSLYVRMISGAEMSSSASASASASAKLQVVAGKVPEDLVATIVCIGPGTFSVPYTRQGESGYETRHFKFGHIRDALPVATRVTIDGRASVDKQLDYASRPTAQSLFNMIQQSGGYIPEHSATFYGTGTNQSFIAKLMAPAPISSRLHNEPDLISCMGSIYTKFPGGQSGGNRKQTLASSEYVDENESENGAQNVAKRAGSIYCQNHIGYVQQIDVETLQVNWTRRWEEFASMYKATFTCPQTVYDPTSRELITVSNEIGLSSSTTIKVLATVKHAGKGMLGEIIAEFKAVKPTFINSFAVSPRFVVIPASPSHSSATGLKLKWKASTVCESFGWQQPAQQLSDDPLLFYIISREQGRLIAVYQSPFYHPTRCVSAIEDAENDVLYLDIIVHQNSCIESDLSLANLHSGHFNTKGGELRRFAFSHLTIESERFSSTLSSSGNIKSGTVWPNAPSMPISAVPIDYPKTHPSVDDPSSVPTFVFGLSFSHSGNNNNNDTSTSTSTSSNAASNSASHRLHNNNGSGGMWDSVVKIDISGTNEAITWHRPGWFPSEPAIIARKNAEHKEGVEGGRIGGGGGGGGGGSDGSGYVVFFATDCTLDNPRGYLVILDGASMQEEAVIRLPSPLCTLTSSVLSVPGTCRSL